MVRVPSGGARVFALIASQNRLLFAQEETLQAKSAIKRCWRQQNARKTLFKVALDSEAAARLGGI